MLTKYTKILYQVQFSPFWQDNCNHGEAAYVFSFIYEYLDKNTAQWIEEKFDVYTFESHTLGQEWCLRFGNEDSNYYSPTNTINMMSINHEPYTLCINILKELGNFRWIKNENS